MRSDGCMTSQSHCIWFSPNSRCKGREIGSDYVLGSPRPTRGTMPQDLSSQLTGNVNGLLERVLVRLSRIDTTPQSTSQSPSNAGHCGDGEPFANLRSKVLEELTTRTFTVLIKEASRKMKDDRADRWEISRSRLMICIMGLNVDADAVTGNSEQLHFETTRFILKIVYWLLFQKILDPGLFTQPTLFCMSRYTRKSLYHIRKSLYRITLILYQIVANGLGEHLLENDTAGLDKDEMSETQEIAVTDLRLTVGRVLYTLHCRSQGPGRGSAHRLAARGLAMLSKVHTREYAVFLQNFTALITPWEGKLPFFQRSHSGRALSDMEAETPPPPPRSDLSSRRVKRNSYICHFKLRSILEQVVWQPVVSPAVELPVTLSVPPTSPPENDTVLFNEGLLGACSSLVELKSPELGRASFLDLRKESHPSGGIILPQAASLTPAQTRQKLAMTSPVMDARVSETHGTRTHAWSLQNHALPQGYLPDSVHFVSSVPHRDPFLGETWHLGDGHLIPCCLCLETEFCCTDLTTLNMSEPDSSSVFSGSMENGTFLELFPTSLSTSVDPSSGHLSNVYIYVSIFLSLLAFLLLLLIIALQRLKNIISSSSSYPEYPSDAGSSFTNLEVCSISSQSGSGHPVGHLRQNSPEAASQRMLDRGSALRFSYKTSHPPPPPPAMMFLALKVN
eukprot:bmy_03065T0